MAHSTEACTINTEEQKTQMSLKYLEDVLVTVNICECLRRTLSPYHDFFNN